VNWVALSVNASIVSVALSQPPLLWITVGSVKASPAKKELCPHAVAMPIPPVPVALFVQVME